MVDCTGLENRQGETLREFESHRLRHQYIIDSQEIYSQLILLAHIKVKIVFKIFVDNLW